MGPSINQAQQYINTRRMSDDSSISSEGRDRSKGKRANSPTSSLPKQNSFSPGNLSTEIIRPIPSQQMPVSSPRAPPPPPVVQDHTNLYDENRKLRRKLKQLSIRLDEELERAAENKLKQNSMKNGHPASIESQNMQLQNAYKTIERLQKAVHDYQSKQSYQVTLKRVLDLENIIKKKEIQIDALKTEVKTQKKMIVDKDKHIETLLDNTKRMGNPAEDKEVINRLKLKLKKIAEDNDQLRKKELEKHEKLVKAERKVVELEQDIEMPIGKQESLLKEIEDWKKKYKQTMQRVDRQNIYITKLNQKLTKEAQQKSRRSQRVSIRETEKTEKRMIARSLQDLPSLEKKINTSILLEHLPSPKQGSKLRRY